MSKWMPVVKGLLLIGAGLLLITAAAFCCLYVFTGVVGDGDNNLSRSKADLRNLESGLVAYHQIHKHWPDKSERLTERLPNGGAALLKEYQLVDPWGRPYHYDPKLLHETISIPRVWSVGPDPGNPDKKIANWY
jgi:hypothetical protein